MPNYIDIKLKSPVTFRPIADHPKGARARPMSVPAGTVVRATPDSQRTDPKSTWQLLASVDGTDDYYARKVPDRCLDWSSPPPVRRPGRQR